MAGKLYEDKLQEEMQAELKNLERKIVQVKNDTKGAAERISELKDQATEALARSYLDGDRQELDQICQALQEQELLRELGPNVRLKLEAQKKQTSRQENKISSLKKKRLELKELLDQIQQGYGIKWQYDKSCQNLGREEANKMFPHHGYARHLGQNISKARKLAQELRWQQELEEMLQELEAKHGLKIVEQHMEEVVENG